MITKMHVPLTKTVLIDLAMIAKSVPTLFGQPMIMDSIVLLDLLVIHGEKIHAVKVRIHHPLQFSMRIMKIPNSVIIPKIGAWVTLMIEHSLPIMCGIQSTLPQSTPKEVLICRSAKFKEKEHHVVEIITVLNTCGLVTTKLIQGSGAGISRSVSIMDRPTHCKATAIGEFSSGVTPEQ